jgi:TRAP-type C4-dicarboxylate transport system permease small subunit
MEIESKEARKRLAITWLTFTGAILCLLVGQQLNGKFEDKSKDAWLWFTSNITPFLTLVLSGFILDINSKQSIKVDKIYYRLSNYISIFYLMFIMAIMLFSPFSNLGEVQLMKETNLFLTIIQSILSILIGVFYLQGNGSK